MIKAAKGRGQRRVGQMNKPGKIAADGAEEPPTMPGTDTPRRRPLVLSSSVAPAGASSFFRSLRPRVALRSTRGYGPALLRSGTTPPFLSRTLARAVALRALSDARAVEVQIAGRQCRLRMPPWAKPPRFSPLGVSGATAAHHCLARGYVFRLDHPRGARPRPGTHKVNATRKLQNR